MTEEHDWIKVRKKPIEVHYRKVQPYELGIMTLEGFKECNLKDHYIIMGIAGEQYPIKKCIFHQTYTTKFSLNHRTTAFLLSITIILQIILILVYGGML